MTEYYGKDFYEALKLNSDTLRRKFDESIELDILVLNDLMVNNDGRTFIALAHAQAALRWLKNPSSLIGTDEEPVLLEEFITSVARMDVTARNREVFIKILNAILGVK